MDPIYVTGHRNPDTDSIVAAMAYAALRNAVGDREYEAACLGHVSDETQAVLEKFGFHNTSEEAMLARWQESNPGAKIISKGGGAWMRGESGSLMLNGLGASNRRQIYILFKFDRNLGPAVPPPQV